MADYLRREAARLRGQSRDALLAGRISFGAPPQGAAAALAKAEAS
jgi:hypothetical protein